MCLFLVVESIWDEFCPLNAGKVCFVSGKSQRTWGSKVHTSSQSHVEVWLRRSPEYLGQTVIPPIFIAALMLFILKTFLFLWPVTAVASKFLAFVRLASFLPNVSGTHTMASQSQDTKQALIRTDAISGIFTLKWSIADILCQCSMPSNLSQRIQWFLF